MSPTPVQADHPGLRWWYRLAVAVAVSPIVVAAVRNGLAGWQPTLDAAITTVRIRDVISAHPPLVGLAAQTSFEASEQYSYLGALQFYLLALPVRVLGVTWGVTLGMAAINAGAAVTALWLVRRRAGEHAAVLAALFVSALCWTLGSQMLIEPAPVSVGIVPMFAFLVAAWAAADGDRAGLAVTVVVANYLVLTHPKFIVVAPVLAVFAIVLWARQRLELRRVFPSRFDRHWRRDRRVLWGCGAFTVLVWLPPLFDEVRSGGGNLGRFVDAAMSGQADELQSGALEPTFSGALGMLTAVTAVPPAWLPGSFADPPFDRLGGGTPFVVGLVCALVLAGLLAWVTLLARRRDDPIVGRAVAVGVVAWAAYLATALLNPDSYGFRARYFYELWPLGAFLWLVVMIGLLRGPGRRLVESTDGAGAATLAVLASTVLVAAAALPYADHAEAKSAPLIPPATQIRDTVAAEYADSGPVLVLMDLTTSRLWPAVMLGLQDADVPIRVVGSTMVQQFGGARDYAVHRDAERTLVLSDSWIPPPPGARKVAEFDLPVSSSPEQFAADSAKMRRWADSIDSVQLTPGLVASTAMMGILDQLVQRVDEAGLVGEALLEDPSFLATLMTAQPFLDRPIVPVPGMSGPALARWTHDQYARANRTVLYELDPIPVPKDPPEEPAEESFEEPSEG